MSYRETVKPLRFTRTLVALDVDDTLLSAGQKIPDATIGAVRKVASAGHAVVLASGRSIAGIRPVIRQLGLRSGWAVCSNGAVTTRFAGRRLTIESRVTFDPSAVVQRAFGMAPDALGAVEDIDRGGWRVSAKFPKGQLNGIQRQVRRGCDLWEKPTTRAVIHVNDATELVNGFMRHEVTATPARRDWLDLTAKNISKATALEQIRIKENIAKNATIAIGDGLNDIPSFRWAGVSVAMGQASDYVKAAADFITGTIDEHGAIPILHSLSAEPSRP